MVDPISVTASLLDILQKLAGLGRGIWRWVRRKPPNARTEGPLDSEIRPTSFTIDLAPEVPRIEIRFQAINYLSRPRQLEDVHVTRLSLSNGASNPFAIDGVRLVPALEGLALSPRRSRMIFCAKNLLDSEARMLRSFPLVLSGSFSLTAKGRAKRREYRYGPLG